MQDAKKAKHQINLLVIIAGLCALQANGSDVQCPVSDFMQIKSLHLE